MGGRLIPGLTDHSTKDPYRLVDDAEKAACRGRRSARLGLAFFVKCSCVLRDVGFVVQDLCSDRLDGLPHSSH